MIWQLMKLDPTWAWTAILTLISVFFCALGGSFIVAALLLFSCGVMATQTVDAGFYASLPVPARQVWLERTLAVNVMLWLPLSIAGRMLMLGRPGDASAGSVIAIGSVLMLVLQLILTAKFRSRNAPGWLIGLPVLMWLASSWFPAVPGAIAKWQGWLFRESEGVAIPVVGSSWILTVIVFLTGLLMTPDSFLLERAVGTSNAVPRAAAIRSRNGITPHLSLIRIFLSFSHLWILYLLAGTLAGLQLSDDIWVFVFIMLFTVRDSIGRGIRWMSFLPVPPGILLATILLPALFAVAAGYSLGIHIPVNRFPVLRGIAGVTGLQTIQEPHGQIIEIMILSTGLMMMTLLWMTENWKSLGGRVVVRIILMVPCSVLLVNPRLVSAILPGSLPAAIAVIAVPLALLYWALDAMFRKLEFVDKPASGDLA